MEEQRLFGANIGKNALACMPVSCSVTEECSECGSIMLI